MDVIAHFSPFHFLSTDATSPSETGNGTGGGLTQAFQRRQGGEGDLVLEVVVIPARILRSGGGGARTR